MHGCAAADAGALTPAPSHRPLQIALVLIGINNELDSQPWDKLDYLLGWMGAAMPLTKIVVLAPLPSIRGRSSFLLKEYKPMLERRGVELSLCGGVRAGLLLPARCWRSGTNWAPCMPAAAPGSLTVA